MLMTDVPNYKKNLADIVAIYGRGPQLFRPPMYVRIYIRGYTHSTFLQLQQALLLTIFMALFINTVMNVIIF
jgi:hypothetical protein